MIDRFVAKRYINIFLIFLVTVLYTVMLGVFRNLFWDEIILYLCVGMIFFVLFVLALENNRSKDKLSGNRENSYHKICIGFTVAALLMAVSVYLPEFLKPALLAAVILTGLGNREIALCAGIYFDMILCLALETPVQEAAFCCLMTAFGCMFADTVRNKKKQIWCVLLIFSLSAMMPQIFYYLTYRELKNSIFFYGMIEGLCSVLFLLLFYYRLANEKETEISDILDAILDESYPLTRELNIFSKAEYRHARRVSEKARECARAAGADEKVCAAAGFYYRIGILESGSMVANGIRIAQRECFPEKVIRIISEYNGEEALPSSVESAIVHMVDGLIKKMEVLSEQTSMSSEWNRDMVIYQTLNEFSAEGLYDRSGLSMNMFLKIREYLVKEESLL